ncbi:histidine kinase dimerization/phospho-acceptor domain-containing protein [Acetobacter sp.]|uniref:sensor histidine kinase n=1 Tax=Acetobacter sp. TaxID=440 RepID=UPI0039EBEBF3
MTQPSPHPASRMAHTPPTTAHKTVRPWRLSTRLLRGVTAVVIGCLIIVSLLTVAFTKFEITERLDDSLQEVAERLQFAVLVLNQQGSGHDIAHLSNITPTSLAYQITDAQGQVLLRSPNAPEQAFVLPHDAGFYMQPHFRVYVTPAAQKNRFIMVAEPRVHRSQATHHAILIAVLPILGAIPCIWLLVMWQVRRSLKPLVQLQHAIRERGSGNLNPVPDLALPHELATIQTAVNLLLERLHKALAAERAFAANAAHELRNPIAALLAQTQMLRSTLPSETPPDTPGTTARHRVDTMISQIQRLSRITEKLLQLSRAVAGTGFQRQPFDMLEVLNAIADELDPPHGAAPQRLLVETEPYTRLVVLGDMDATGILLRNLLENALRHSPDGSCVRVAVTLDTVIRTDAGSKPSFSAQLILKNDAPPLPDATLSALTDPFVRGGSQAEGSGLGLAIARTISTQMHIPMQIYSPIPNQKTGFMVRLFFQIDHYETH